MSLATAPPKDMNGDYDNLWIVYRTCWELDRTMKTGQCAVALFTNIGSPNAASVQG